LLSATTATDNAGALNFAVQAAISVSIFSIFAAGKLWLFCAKDRIGSAKKIKIKIVLDLRFTIYSPVSLSEIEHRLYYFRDRQF
jgi:hypothetical protein